MLELCLHLVLLVVEFNYQVVSLGYQLFFLLHFLLLPIELGLELGSLCLILEPQRIDLALALRELGVKALNFALIGVHLLQRPGHFIRLALKLPLQRVEIVLVLSDLVRLLRNRLGL